MEKYKRRLWLFQAPLVLMWTLLFWTAEQGNAGILKPGLVFDKIYPTALRLSGLYTDLKFRTRGPRPVKEKIVIVEIDDEAVSSSLGRWPWHRDVLAMLTLTVMQRGAKAVGLDIVFAEPDVRVSLDTAEFLEANGLGEHIPRFETDLVLKRIIDLYRDKLVLGWMSDTTCRPSLGPEACNVTAEEVTASLPDGFDKFAFDDIALPKTFDPASTPVVSAQSVVTNLPTYNESALYSGFLVNAVEEADEVVRRAQAALFVNRKPYPSLPLQMASIGLKDKLSIRLNDHGLIERVGFVKSKREVPVSPTGAIAINFRGAAHSFPYVGALSLFTEEPQVAVYQAGQSRLRSVDEVFKDAYVIIGVSAMGARDLRHFPFSINTPGSEGLATILDNVLAGDALLRAHGPWSPTLLLLLMTLGAAGFCYLLIRLPASPSVLVSIAVMGAIAVLDAYYVFGQLNVDLNTVFLLAQLASIFIVTVAVKYIIEERGKRTIRSTFAKYLAPEVVDEMLQDPDNLKLGGETRQLTIMMSDLRGFTATAERLPAAAVLEMLNHYLGTMADIIVDYRGTIDEFIGDAILVIFGAPIERPDDARRAVACCLAMQKAMAGVNAVNAAKGLPKLEMGIALNTGVVTVGNIGSERRLKYGVVGSHVNLTARIESNTVGGQLLISESTLKLAGADIKLGEKYSIIAKGFPEPVVAYDVLGIGGEYGIYLDEVDLGLTELSEPREVHFKIMKGKNDEGPEQIGELTALSELGCMLNVREPIEALANLKLQLWTHAPLDGDVYAKVVASGTACKLRFTNLPPAVESHLQSTLGKSDGERAAELLERS